MINLANIYRYDNFLVQLVGLFIKFMCVYRINNGLEMIRKWLHELRLETMKYELINAFNKT